MDAITQYHRAVTGMLQTIADTQRELRDTVRAFAEAGPDRISVGALTHSARAVDLSLEV